MEVGLFKTEKNSDQLSEFKILELFGLKALGFFREWGRDGEATRQDDAWDCWRSKKSYIVRNG